MRTDPLLNQVWGRGLDLTSQPTLSHILFDLRGKLPKDLEQSAAIARHQDGGNDATGALQAQGYATTESLTALYNLSEEARTASTEDQLVAAYASLTVPDTS
ncbi:MAG TPA: hypothetical protein VGT61_06880 [Thermomicrobiales bacterium]|nr:hypothetical protein [Thermomicrobiales bacterium]